MSLHQDTTAPRSPAWIFLQPHAALLSQKARPRPLLLLVLLLACAVLPQLIFVSRADLRHVVETELKKAGKYDQMPPEVREQALSVGPKAFVVLAPGGAGLKRLCGLLLIAALGFAVLRGASPGLSFSAALGAVALGSLPLALGDLVLAVVFGLSDLTRLELENPVASNLAALLSMDARSGLGVLCKSVDLFQLWAVVLVGMGLQAVSGRRGSLGLVVSAGCFAAFTLLGVITAMAAMR